MTPERFQNGSGTVPERFRNGSGPGCVLLVFLVLCFVLPFGAGWIGCRQDKPSLNRSKPRVWEKKAKERAASNPGPNYSEALSAKTLPSLAFFLSSTPSHLKPYLSGPHADLSGCGPPRPPRAGVKVLQGGEFCQLLQPFLPS